jgi:hypothetical protein
MTVNVNIDCSLANSISLGSNYHHKGSSRYYFDHPYIPNSNLHLHYERQLLLSHQSCLVPLDPKLHIKPSLDQPHHHIDFNFSFSSSFRRQDLFDPHCHQGVGKTLFL